jgi:adenine-specific DNA-methyltransferase
MIHEFKRLLGQLNSTVGKPYFAEDGFILFNGDCAEVLARLADAGLSTPLTLTSPPYNIGKEFEKPLALPDYLAWCEKWCKLIWDVTAPAGAFWLNLGHVEVPSQGKCVPLAYLLWDKTPFHLQQEVVWYYGAGVASKMRFSARNEKWLFFTKHPREYVFNLDAVRDPNVKYPNQKKYGRYRCNPLGKNPSDVWEMPKVTSGRNRSSKERTKHPAQFPLAVVNRVVRVSSNVGDVVLDPFSGSPSTGIAAVGNGRVYIGIERRLDYCEMAVERFRGFEARRRELASQTTLFGQASSQAVEK